MRAIARPNGDARVVFLVARISDDTSLVDNINSRYVVESVATSGVPEEEIAQDLRDRLQALVGKPLSSEEADALSDKLRVAFPGYEVKRRISRGTVRGRIRWSSSCPGSRGAGFPSLHCARSSSTTRTSSGAACSTSWWAAGIIAWAARSSSTTTTISSRSTPGSDCASRAESSPPIGSARASSSRGSRRMACRHVGGAGADPRIPEPYRTRVTVEPTVTVRLQPVRPGVRRRQRVGPRVARSRAGLVQRQRLGGWHRRLWSMARRHQQAAGRRRVSAARGHRVARERPGLQAAHRRRAFPRGGRSQHAAGRRFRSATSPARRRSSSGFRLATPPRCAAGTSTTSRLLAAIGCGTSRWNTDIAAARSSSTPARCGIQATRQRARLSAGFGIHTYNFFLLGGFPLNADNAGGTFMVGVRF